MDQNLSDHELAVRAASGDRTARDRLIARHLSDVRHLCRCMCPDHANLDDLVQDTLVALLRDLGSYRGSASFPTWAYTVARTHLGRTIRSDLRHRARTNRFERHVATITTDVTGDEALAAIFLRDRVARAATRLSELDRAVLTHRDVRGDTARETALILGLTVPAVKTRLHRARARMRELLAPVHPQTQAA